MNEIITLERVVAVLCLGAIFINILQWIQSVRIAIAIGSKHETTITSTAIAAFLLSVCVVIQWVAV